MYVGVRLWSELTDSLVPNNTMLFPGVGGDGNITGGLSCYTAREGFDHQGNWFDPNGNLVKRRNFGGVLYTSDLNRNIQLLKGSGPSFDSSGVEGVYSCRILDENNDEQTLYAGLYKTETYLNSG